MSTICELTDANFRSEVLDSDRPVLVDFWAPWCNPCRAVGPTIEELARDYDGKVVVGKLNVDRNQQSAMDFDIRSIPAVLLFRDGDVVDTVVGVHAKERYEHALQQVA